MLAIGEQAPAFVVRTLRGETVRLSNQHRPVWLAFFRFASCPLCNYRVHELIEVWDRFVGRDFRMLAVFQSPAKRLADFVAKQRPPFDLIADPERELYAMYGLESSWLKAATPRVMGVAMRAMSSGVGALGAMDGPVNRVPGDYLIDRDGRICDVYRGEDISDHLPVETALRFLDAQGA